MKRFFAVMNDGSSINVQATRMEKEENSILVWDGNNLVAYIDVSSVIYAHICEKKV